ncbi:MAG: hypothetical protein LAN62_11755 [Acidobacteriia bacterium]|nr:hypothetical protein [Terriglobia bacterium]
MLGRLVNNLRARLAIRTLDKNPVYRAAVKAIRETLADDSKGLGKCASQMFKEELAERLIREAGEVVMARDSIMANREKLASYVLEMAAYQVLILASPMEEEEDVTGLRGRPGITGELKPHLQEIAEKDKDIKELASSLDNPTPQDLYEVCLYKYWVVGFMAGVFNCIRIALGDYHSSAEKDWYRPFVAAMCAWEEHKYREAIGLPDVLGSQDDYGSMAALKYSTFFNIVMTGAKYPNLEWEEHFKPEHT